MKRETIGATSATLIQMNRLAYTGAAVVLAAGSVAAVVALNSARTAFVDEHTRPLAVGDCVVVASAPPDEVQARRASCTEDPSYTVGALATSVGECPSSEYQHFAAPAADRATASVCLVPNLVADHCYRLGMPIGVVERADCTESRSDTTSGLLVHVTERLDVRDQYACPTDGGQYAWPYPSPARTYCTATLF